SAVPLAQGGHVIGVFGQVKHLEDRTPAPAHPHLTPRQSEVLGLLEHGRSTEQIAQELSLSVQTVRNHIRHLLHALGVHTRLDAGAVARHDHLIPGCPAPPRRSTAMTPSSTFTSTTS